MSIALVVSAVVGFLTVLQATFNRQIARAWGLAPAAVLNTAVAVVLSLAFLAFCVWRGSDTGLSRVSFDIRLMRAWWLLPGCFGIAIVIGLPWAVSKVGALPVFVALVAAQVVTSALWDRLVDEAPLSPARIAGAVLAVASVALANWK
jgi:transporter family-2 protein